MNRDLRRAGLWLVAGFVFALLAYRPLVVFWVLATCAMDKYCPPIGF